MKSLRFLYSFLSLVSASALFGEELRLDQKIAVDVSGEDATFQIVSGLESEGKLLCLWKGETLQAFVNTSFEATEGDEAEFLKRTLSGMKAQGAKKVKAESRDAIRAGDLTFHAHIVRSKHGDTESAQLMYILKMDEGIEFILVTLPDAGALKKATARADKLIATATLIGE